MRKGKGGILAMGHVLVDIFGEDTGSLAGFAGASRVSHLKHDEMAGILAKIESSPQFIRGSLQRKVGGGQALLSVAARAMGAEVRREACKGNDAEGDFLQSELAEQRLDLGLATGLGRTGIFLNLSAKGGDKRIFVDPGAAREIRGRAFDPGVFKPGWILSLDGLLIDSPSWLAETAEEASRAGMKVALDLSTPSNAVVQGMELKDFAARHCDFVFANEKEFEELEHAAGKISSPRETWIVKLGPGGARSFRGNRTWLSETQRIETNFDTGAGDFFAAGYLCGLLADLDDKACLSLGNAAAAALVRSDGLGFPLSELSFLGKAIGFA